MFSNSLHEFFPVFLIICEFSSKQMAKISANESPSMSNCTSTEKEAEQRFFLPRSEQSSSPPLQSHHILQAVPIFQRKEKDQGSH